MGRVVEDLKDESEPYRQALRPSSPFLPPTPLLLAAPASAPRGAPYRRRCCGLAAADPRAHTRPRTNTLKSIAVFSVCVYRKMVMETVDKVVQNLGAADIGARGAWWAGASLLAGGLRRL